MKNPNGYGSVVKLSGSRRKPFMVRKTAGYKANGAPIYDIIGYAATREEGNILLADYNKNSWDIDKIKISLEDLYKLWQEKKTKKMSKSLLKSLSGAYTHCDKLYKKPYKGIKAYHMQECIDNCGYGHATQANIKNLFWHLDKFALEMDISSNRYADLLTADPTPETTRECFSSDEIADLWTAYDTGADDFAGKVLVMIYSGWRISEFLALKLADADIKEGTMKGGLKTVAGKNRIVPIHSAIAGIVKQLHDRSVAAGSEYWICGTGGKKDFSIAAFRKEWTICLNKLGIDKTPHETRHTFETLLDSAGANRKCIDMMMGHVSAGTGTRVYTHKTLDELKLAIELIKKPQLATVFVSDK